MNLTQPVQSVIIQPFVKSGYAYTYYPKKSGVDDVFSTAILEMKNGYRPDLEAIFALKAVEFVLQNNLKLSGIVRALGSKEMCDLDNHPLHRVAALIADHLDIPYKNNWLAKKPTIKTSKLGSRINRFNHINNTYCATMEVQDEPATILVIDDIITTRTTAREIHRALSQGNPQIKCCFFALAETFYQAAQSKKIAYQHLSYR